MNDYQPYDTEWFKKNDLPAPSLETHGTDEDIRDKLKPLKTWGWKLEGNQLSCQTDHGPLTQTIPSNYICLGTDDSGKPLLKKIEL